MTGAPMSEIDLSLLPISVAEASRYRGASVRAKRALDVFVASIVLLLVSPLLLVIAVAIRLDSPGPAIFTQTRIGARRSRERREHGYVLRPFTIYKFRTMAADADPSLHREYMTAYLASDAESLASLRPDRTDGESFRPAHDPRVTRLGALLRRLSLDELPQLWNVIKGDMSLVGPRPPLPYEVEMYDARHMQRLASPPGLTGWAQINGRCAIGFEEMVRLDIEYMQRRSTWFDMRILLMTVPLVLSRRGAD
jgi:lipopolysaccharide/colanic/teichoic acid biosynthesis glycosyltransferase